jgi:hypothetical protein
MYDELRENDRIVKQQEEFERREQYRLKRLEYDLRLRTIEKKHADEITVLKMAQDLRIDTVRSEANLEIERAQKRVHTLEISLDGVSDSERVWNLHHRFQVQKASPTARGVSQEDRRRRSTTSFSPLKTPPLSQRPRSSIRGSRRSERPQSTVVSIPMSA